LKAKEGKEPCPVSCSKTTVIVPVIRGGCA